MPISVALLTSSDLKCGIGEYGRLLMKQLPQIEWTVVGHRTLQQDLKDKNFDIVHLNFEPNLFPNPGAIVAALKQGKRSLLTVHCSHAGNNRNALTELFNAVVIHEFCVNLNESKGRPFLHIPMGIPDPLSEADLQEYKSLIQSPPLDLGTAGFPFPWKGFTDVASAAHQLRMSVGLVMAESHHADYRLMDRACRQACPSTKVVTISDWVPDRGVIAFLSSCRVNVFAYHGGNSGISGAVRLGLATGNPIVVSMCRQFNDLYGYKDEIEFAGHPGQITEGIKRVLKSGKKPRRILEDYSWKRSAGKYLSLYEALLS